MPVVVSSEAPIDAVEEVGAVYWIRRPTSSAPSSMMISGAVSMVCDQVLLEVFVGGVVGRVDPDAALGRAPRTRRPGSRAGCCRRRSRRPRLRRAAAPGRRSWPPGGWSSLPFVPQRAVGELVAEDRVQHRRVLGGPVYFAVSLLGASAGSFIIEFPGSLLYRPPRVSTSLLLPVVYRPGKSTFRSTDTLCQGWLPLVCLPDGFRAAPAPPPAPADGWS